MTEQTNPVLAVLSGDIIGSTERDAKAITRIRDSILESVARFEYDWGDCVIGTPDFFSGDAWQLAMSNPALSLRLAILIRAELRAKLDADTRISIGIGEAVDVREDEIALSSGERCNEHLGGAAEIAVVDELLCRRQCTHAPQPIAVG